jgi:hypothetical protein
MSKGIGKTQRAILDTLANEHEAPALTVIGLAERIGVSDSQIRRAVRALEGRKLVCITRGHAWHGVGEYGPLVEREHSDLSNDVPTAEVVDGVEFVRCGMPTVALEVWLPDNLAEYLARRKAVDAINAGIRRRGSAFATDEELDRLQEIASKGWNK